MTGGIFISYRREDTAGFAGRIYDRLKSHFDPKYLFLDVDNIDPGLDFTEILSERVGGCDALIAIIGKSWTECRDKKGDRRLDDPNDFVRIEIEAALKRNVRVIPVLVDDAPMPQAEQLPASLAGLARRQNVEISHRYFDTDAGRLVQKLAFVEDQIRQRTEQEAQRLFDEEVRRNAEAEARRLADEEARRQAEVEARRKDEEEVKRQGEREERLQAEAQARQKAVREERKKAEIDARRKAEALRKSEEEARRRAGDQETQRLAEPMAERQAGGPGSGSSSAKSPDRPKPPNNRLKEGLGLLAFSVWLVGVFMGVWDPAEKRILAYLGNAAAQNSLGRLYSTGKGVAQDYDQAAKWYLKAADKGYSIAQFNLGQLYEQGNGVVQDYNQAAEWYRKASDQGNNEARNKLGDLYFFGKGVARNYAQAAQWYRKAADQGDTRAQYSLGWLYENGYGVARNLETARAWYEKAAAQGDSDAKAALDRLGKQ